jgi:hypothetical protein
MNLLPKPHKRSKWSCSGQLKIWLLQQDLEEVQKNPRMIQEKLDALVKEMSTLKQRTKLANLYHYQMEELKDGTCLCQGKTFDLLKKK